MAGAVRPVSDPDREGRATLRAGIDVAGDARLAADGAELRPGPVATEPDRRPGCGAGRIPRRLAAGAAERAFGARNRWAGDSGGFAAPGRPARPGRQQQSPRLSRLA